MNEVTDRYEAPWMPSAMDKEAEALIKEMETEYVPDPLEVADPAKPVEASTEAGTEGGAAPDVSAVDSAPAVAKTEPKSEEVPGLERFVAREVALREKERVIEEKERRYSQMEARIKELEGRQMPKDLEAEIYADPVSFFERLGIDTDQVVRASLARRMGEKAPKELRADMEAAARDLRTRKEIEALRAEVQAAKTERASREFYDKVVSDVRTFIESPDLPPTVKAIASRNKERVFHEVMDVITRDAQAKSRAGGGDLISFDEAVKQVESKWKDLVALSPLPPSGNASTEAKTAPTTQASGAQKPATPKPTGSVTPPQRPLAPWLQPRADYEDEGLKAAIAEFRRLETPGVQK
jgi:hypothetical protein